MENSSPKALIAISGGISAYKAADVIAGLIAKKFKVRVIATEHALDFITPTVMGAISEGNYITDNNVNRIAHIDEARDCDVFICVPATANIIAKFANGIADDFVSSTFLALPEKTPRIICPAMNTKMYENPITQKNIKILKSILGCKIIEPVVGKLACGDVGIGKLPKPRKIVEEIIEILDTREPWHWPIAMNPSGTTIDSFSYLHFERFTQKKEDGTILCDIENFCKNVEIPLHPHVGSFGVRRRFDRHRGVDLYAPVGTLVFAVEDGVVCSKNGIRPWTGKIANCDWWEDTWAIIVEGKSGMVVYGEIKIDEGLLAEQKQALTIPGGQIHIRKGQVLGTVVRVLKKDKGRPTSMLHIELREPGFYRNIDKSWEGDNIPKGVLDPTPFLIRSARYNNIHYA